MTDKKRFLVVLAVLLCAALALAWRMSCGDAVQAYKNGNLIRLHVVANSNSPVDQAIKFQVRDAIVGAMAQKFGQAEDVGQARKIAEENLPYIQQLAVQKVRAAGEDYPVAVEMGEFGFPARTYQHNLYALTLPAGNYQAVRVVLGRGAGENWWCVLFPPLCFVDPGSVMSAESEKEMEKKQEKEHEKIQLVSRPDLPGDDCASGNDCAAVPAFKLKVPEALVALGSLQKGEDGWTMTAGGEQVQFRLKVLDVFRHSGSWFKRILGEEKTPCQT